ncbi:hypothetical protein B0H14DRAFT_2650967 [Mycena olivaceomarginata]|nr:hypothetical protein B0H14DRAFT_2650967 [Mycena olivaceomarginata]
MKHVTSADWDNSVGILPHQRGTPIPRIVARGVDIGDQLRLRHVGLCQWRHQISGEETISRAIAEKGMPPPSHVTQASSPICMDPVVLPHRTIWPCHQRNPALVHFCAVSQQEGRLAMRAYVTTTEGPASPPTDVPDAPDAWLPRRQSPPQLLALRVQTAPRKPSATAAGTLAGRVGVGGAGDGPVNGN